ncbi:ABC transporter permease [Desulfonatronovibrio magnus]|uniref:ABC transporter permease n=1 Tax=Desulfonatronovibrio magnus TaxID=698827 RepID=UPI0005EAE2F3|nr:ABC transporter permease [Desulfonatronovibrio magnus]
MDKSIFFSFARKQVWLQAWQALTLHRMRSLLSTLGIVFAVMAVVTMLAIAEGAKRQTLEQIGRLGTNTILIRNSETSIFEGDIPSMAPNLGYNDIIQLSQLPGLESISAVRESSTVISELGRSGSATNLSVNPAYIDSRGLNLARGRFISDLDVENRHEVCVLGAELVRRIGHGAEIGSTIHLDGTPCRIIGILRSRGSIDQDALPLTLRDFDNTVITPLSSDAGSMSSFAVTESLSEVLLKVSDVSHIEQTTSAIRRVLLWNRDGLENFEIIIPLELLSQARQAQRLFNIVLGSIAGISMIVGGIGIMNIMLANVSERTREIGIRRAIGANTKHIVTQFLGESILLTVMGGILGILLGSVTALSVSSFIQWQTYISPWSLLLAMLMSIGVGIASGIYPAVKAARMDPVDALRHI